MKNISLYGFLTFGDASKHMPPDINPPPSKNKRHLTLLVKEGFGAFINWVPGGVYIYNFVHAGGREMSKTGWLFMIICMIPTAILPSCYCYQKGWQKGWNSSQNAKGDAMLQKIESIPKLGRETLYQKYMDDSAGDAATLTGCAQNAFRAEDYEWCVKFMDKSVFYQTPRGNDNSIQDYPYYGGALILLNKPNEGNLKLQELLKFIDRDIQHHGEGDYHLDALESLVAITGRCKEVKEKLPKDQKHYMESLIAEIDARISHVKTKQSPE